jgi:hypothetical protein
MGLKMDGTYPLQSKATRRISGYRIFLTILYVIAIIAYIVFLYNGSSFYLSSYKDRPHSELYRTLRPAGITGHGYGIVGSVMVILMLTYSLRKRVRVFRNWGMLSRWLDVHIYFGTIGPLLIVLHTAFKVQGLVAVSFWSMVAVTTSGFFGRYLYLQIPRNIRGDELSLKELEESNQGLSEQLQRDYNLSQETIQRLEQRESLAISEEAGPIRALVTVISNDALSPFRISRRSHEYADLKDIPKADRKKIIRITHRKSLLARRVMLLNQMQRLFHYWHVIHKPFAIIMYVIMVVHIVVAVWTGYRWLF